MVVLRDRKEIRVNGRLFLGPGSQVDEILEMISHFSRLGPDPTYVEAKKAADLTGSAKSEAKDQPESSKIPGIGKRAAKDVK